MGKPLEELEAWAREVGRTVREKLPVGIGFVVVLNDHGDGGYMTYLSNNDRSDCVRMLEELTQMFRDEGAGAPVTDHIDQDKARHVMRRLLKAFHRSGLHPSPELGDGCLINASVMFEGVLTREAFVERAAEAWDLMKGSGQPKPEDGAALEDLLNSEKKN